MTHKTLPTAAPRAAQHLHELLACTYFNGIEKFIEDTEIYGPLVRSRRGNEEVCGPAVYFDE